MLSGRRDFRRSLKIGAGALTIGSLFGNLLSFLRNIILARILAPEDFGLMATVIAAVAATEAFAEVGLRQAVIQNKKGAEEDFINVIWWLSSIRGLCLYLITFIAAPWIADFFNKAEAVTVLRIGFLVLLINGLISPRMHVLEKEFRFQKWVVLMQGSGMLGVFVSVISAFILRNVWALILGYVLEAMLKMVLSFIFFPIKPKIGLYRPYLREVMRFSRGMAGLPILMMLFVQTDTFVIGKVLSVGILGMYSLAKDLADLPNKVFSRISPLILPTLSMIQDDLYRLKNTIIFLTKALVTIGIPFFAFLILYSKPLLSTVYEPGYSVVAAPFSIVCVYTLLFICSSIIMNVYISIGRPQIQRTAAAVRTALFLLLIYPATTYWGLVGASLCMLGAMAASLAMQLFYARRLIGLGLREYFFVWLPGILLSLLVIVPGIFLSYIFEMSSLAGLALGAILCLSSWVLAFFTVNLFQRPALFKK